MVKDVIVAYRIHETILNLRSLGCYFSYANVGSDLNLRCTNTLNYPLESPFITVNLEIFAIIYFSKKR